MTDPGQAQPWTTVLDGRRLRQQRRQHGLSQEKLADQAGLSLTTIARLERQPRASCRSRTLARLAAALGEHISTITGGVIVHAMSAMVVGLGAWSELAREDNQTGVDVDVHEFAVTDDGRRLTLHQDRGFSSSATHPTADHVMRSVLTTVLPDDAEITGEDHPWEWLASLIRNHGVAVTPEQLKAVPYVVEFGPRLSALLQSGDRQER